MTFKTIVLVIKSCVRPVMDISVRNVCPFRASNVAFYYSILSFQFKSITATKSPSLFSTTFSAGLTNLRSPSPTHVIAAAT